MTSMWPLGLLLCSCLLWSTAVSTRGVYSLLYSKSIRAGGTVSVAVRLNGTTGKVNFRVELMDYDGLRLQEGQTFSFDGDGFWSVDFQCSDKLKRQLSTLYMRMQAWGGITFDHFTPMIWRGRRMTVFLQTDKRFYLPGSTVKFRALSMRQDTSVSTDKMTIVITDPYNSQVAKYTRKEGGDLAFEGEMLTPENLRLGEYSIRASVKGASRTKYFTVKKYDISDFYMMLWFPTVSCWDGEVKARIFGKYLLGTPVKGSGTITMTVPKYYYYYYWYWWWRYRSYYYAELTKDFELDSTGEGRVSFSMTEVRDVICRSYYPYYYWHRRYYCYRYSYYLLYRHIKFSATIKDKNSYARVTRDKWVQLSAYKYYLKFVDPSSFYFKPGLEHTTYVQDVRSSGKPNTKPQVDHVNFTVSYYNSSYCSRYYSYYYYYRYGQQTLLTQSVKLDTTTSIATLTIDKIPNDACGVRIYATNGKRSTTRYLSRFYSPSKTYLHIKMNSKATVDRQRRVSITSNKNFQNYMVVGFSKGAQVFSERVTRKIVTAEASYPFNVTRDMVPNLKVIVILDRSGSEMVADAMSVDIDYEEYEVELDIDGQTKKTLKPGATAPLKAKAIKDSVVFAMGKDSEEMTRANDIKREDLYKALLVHDTARKLQHYFDVYSNDVADLFRYSGVDMITNMYIPGNYYYYYYYLPRHYRWWSYYYYYYYRYRYYYACQRYKPSASPPERTRLLTMKPMDNPDDNILETWLFNSVKITSNNQKFGFKPVPKAPDTLQTLNINGFAVHGEKGIVFVKKIVELKIENDMFVTMYLPKTAVRKEVVCFRALAHNSADANKTVDIKINRNEDGFDVVRVEKDGNTTNEVEENAYVTKDLGTVEAGVIKAASFCIKPKALGDLSVTVVATIAGARDTLEGKIKVRPEGVPRSKSYAVPIEITSSGTFSTFTNLDLPSDAKDGSYQLEVQVAADPLGFAVNNVDNLLDMPNGNAEQNLAKMGPAVYMIQYLEQTKRSTTAILSSLKSALQTSYHHEMMFQRFDGSFSNFGNNDQYGSTWVSAYVTKVFAQAHDLGEDYVNIEPDIIRRVIGFTTQYQNADGSFVELGRKIHPILQGSSLDSRVSLTAFVAIALAEAKAALSKRDHQTAVARIEYALPKAVTFLENKLSGLTDKYAICITAHALALAGSSSKADAAITKLNETLTTDGTMKYWDGKTKAQNIEMTSHALMALVKQKENTLALAAFRWLNSQRGHKGGFVSTYDTVLGMEALSQMTKTAFNAAITATVTVKRAVGSVEKSKSVTVDGSDDIKPSELNFYWPDDQAPGKVTVEGSATVASGKRTWAFAVVTVHYTVDSVAAKGGLKVETKTYAETMWAFKLKTCVTGNTTRTSHDPLLMTVVTLPTGYKLNKTASTYGFLHRAMQNGDDEVVLYHSEENTRQRRKCSNLKFDINAKVAYSKGFHVRTVNAHNPVEEEAVSTVSMTQYKVCDVATQYEDCDA